MTVFTETISPLYSIDGIVVFYQKNLYKSVNTFHQALLSGNSKAMDIFGNQLTPDVAAQHLLHMVDYPGELSYAEKVGINSQIGRYLVALWREYVASTGVAGQGIPQLQAFSPIGLGLLLGCLYEGALMIPSMPEDSVITPEIKSRFSLACLAADRLN